MVSQGNSELRIDITSINGTSAFETFQNFQIKQGPSYTLYLDQGVGTAGTFKFRYCQFRCLKTYSSKIQEMLNYILDMIDNIFLLLPVNDH